MEKADIVLCLISNDFIASEFCHEKELDKALKAHHKKEKVVIPILIRSCAWEGLPISEIQGLPDQWLNRMDNDPAWTTIAQGIEKVIKKIQKEKPILQRGKRDF